ncbi:MAG: hypothetical protein ABI824_01510 [Acidobacteriota bacterium]
MKTTPSFAKQVAAFPAVLRELIEGELEAGNSIVELSSTFPAPPAGAYVKLENPVSTRPRETAGGVDFYDRNSSSYSGEFTDEKRFYFVLEPPHPPEPEPDMDAIRAAIEEKQRAADAMLYASTVRDEARNHNETQNYDEPLRYVEAAPSPIPPERVRPATPRVTTAVDRFRESMICTYDRWHDGIGYDLAILKAAAPEELVEIENLLLSRSVDDWRDVEALAALDSPQARVALRKALKSSDHRVRLAVADYAPNLISEAERTTALVHALEGSDTYGGLTQALLQVEEFHPPQIMDALLRGVLSRSDGPPVHFAAMLMFLHGKASSAFDWEQRPFYLKFNTGDRRERIQLFKELCAKLGVDAKKYLDGV